eukprot:7288569-Prymnesium_polylepis.3
MSIFVPWWVAISMVAAALLTSSRDTFVNSLSMKCWKRNMTCLDPQKSQNRFFGFFKDPKPEQIDLPAHRRYSTWWLARSWPSHPVALCGFYERTGIRSPRRRQPTPPPTHALA